MKHFTEHILIAYQMNESADRESITEHLEVCPECAQAAEAIGETLRIFSAEPIPQVNVDHAWQRLRGNLPLLSPPPQQRRFRKWLAIPATAAALLVVFVMTHARTATIDSGPTASLAHGPLTLQPRDPNLTTHLDSAERLLTELNHSSGALDDCNRNEAHELLLSNALYIRKANSDGDTVAAAVLDKLGRSLTNLEHHPAAEKTDSVRLDTESLLLNLRILHQNDSTPTREFQ